MATLIAKIDSLDEKWGEFFGVWCNCTPKEIHDWLVENCSCPREEVDLDEVFSDVVLQQPEWIVTWYDCMCDNCFLYEL